MNFVNIEWCFPFSTILKSDTLNPSSWIKKFEDQLCVQTLYIFLKYTSLQNSWRISGQFEKVLTRKLKVVLAWSRELKLALHELKFFLQSTNIRVLNAMTKVTFLLFCYFFEQIFSKYLHVISQKISSTSSLLSTFFFFFFFFNIKFHFCDGKLISSYNSPC